MDRYEYKIKFDEIKGLAENKKWDAAVTIADTINWKKVGNMSALVLAAEVYENADRFDDSIELLLMAYDKSPIGKKILYKLAEIAVKTGNLPLAEEYYREYVDVAPHDTGKFVLALEISKAKGEPVTSQIHILEELKDQQFTEEWAYELAYLYHKAGDGDKCVRACDEIVLWFGDGEYVEKALELKMLYEPLNEAQQSKYKDIKEKKDGIKEVIPEVPINLSGYDTVNLQEELVRGMRQIINAKDKGQITSSMESIQKALEEIPYLAKALEETEVEEKKDVYIESEEEIDARIMVNFHEILKEEDDGQMSLDIPDREMVDNQITGQLTIQDALAEWEKNQRAAEQAMKIAEEEKLEAAKQRAIQQTGVLVDKLSAVLPESIDVDSIINRVQESVEEDEKEAAEKTATEQAEMAQSAVTPADISGDKDEKSVSGKTDAEEIRSYEPEDRQHAVPEAHDTELFAEPDAGSEQDQTDTVTTEAVIDTTEESELVADAAAQSGMPESTQTVGANDVLQDPDLQEIRQTEPVQSDTVMADNIQEDIPDIGASVDAEGVETDAERHQAPWDRFKSEMGQSGEIEQAMEGFEEEVEEHDPADRQEHVVSARIIPEDDSDMKIAGAEKAAESVQTKPEDTREIPDIERALKSGKGVGQETTPLPELDLDPELFAQAKAADTEKMEQTTSSRRKKKGITVAQTTASLMSGGITELDDELKDIFTYFLDVEGIEQQIISVLNGTGKALMYRENCGSGNIAIAGISGSGKTTLGTDLARALSAVVGRPNKHIGKVAAENLNGKDIGKIMTAVAGGCLIIEKADKMNRKTSLKLSKLIPQDKSGTLYILEGTAQGLKRIFTENVLLAGMFSEKIIIPNFSVDELISFAKSYSMERGYRMDDIAVLALYNRIGAAERFGKATCLLQVKDIMDEAISRVERGGLKKLAGIVTGKRYDSENYIIIKEKDIEAR
ncbi:MAG: tetratricopeptide repeat protein [Lachnospiraceae bacterium]|nr:tetratricopeptide repeat protein [Lachnospiraceae bacterium]